MNVYPVSSLNRVGHSHSTATGLTVNFNLTNILWDEAFICLLFRLNLGHLDREMRYLKLLSPNIFTL